MNEVVENGVVMENSLIQNITSLKYLPKNWEVFTFSNLIDDVSGGNLKTQKSDFLEKGLVPIIDQGKDLIAGYINSEKAIIKTKVPHIVFGDHTRILKYIDFPFGMGADGTKVLKVKSNVKALEKYIYYFFQTLNIPETGYNRHFKYLKESLIPIPPLEQQQKIASILDKADELCQYNKQLIEKYDTLTQSLFLEMFGDVWKNLNKFPTYLFDEISTKITDGDHLTPKREENGYKLLSCRNIKNGFIDFSVGLDYVGESEFQRMFKRCNPEKGDILISCSGTIGRTTSIKIDEPFVLVRSAALIKPKKDLVNSLYLEFYLRTSYMQSIMKRSSNTSSQANLFTGPIKKLPILLPPLELQSQFAERVQLIGQQKKQAVEALAKSEDLFQSLLQRAFKGELN